MYIIIVTLYWKSGYKMANLFTLLVCLYFAGSVKSIGRKSVNSTLCFGEEETYASICESINKNKRNKRESIPQNLEKIDSMNEQLSQMKWQIAKLMEDTKEEGQQVCLAPFVRVADSCLLIGNEELKYDHASLFCADYEANLAKTWAYEFETEPLPLFELRNFLKEFAGHVNPPHHCYWLGATDREEEGNWKWFDGTEVDNYGTSFWYRGRPQQDYESADCASICGSRWEASDAPCFFESFPLCQYNLKKSHDDSL